ncbi:MAG: hypothetical protein IPO98_16600 [Saprospiraceae bacterium]|nr:hypothetical protein [Saprospiraceae bacterium]
MRSTNCLKKQFIWRVKARRIFIQRVESLTYAGVTPRSISKLPAIGGWFGVIHALKPACSRVGQVSRTAKVGTDV